jgi:FPC/CPF motif-containing protein YcgG
MDDKRSKNHTWRITTYAAEPDAGWLTEEEAREWRGYLTRSRVSVI